VTEREAITKEYDEMLARLCKIKDAWCLPGGRRPASSVSSN